MSKITIKERTSRLPCGKSGCVKGPAARKDVRSGKMLKRAASAWVGR